MDEKEQNCQQQRLERKKLLPPHRSNGWNNASAPQRPGKENICFALRWGVLFANETADLSPLRQKASSGRGDVPPNVRIWFEGEILFRDVKKFRSPFFFPRPLVLLFKRFGHLVLLKFAFFTFFYINRRKYWFRANFRLPIFDGLTRFEMS